MQIYCINAFNQNLFTEVRMINYLNFELIFDIFGFYLY